jgi:hypothetical protein
VTIDAASGTTGAPPFELIEDDQNRLTLRRPGADDVKDVRLRRAFPWSKPWEYLSIRSGEGKELLLIEDLRTLESSARQLIERWLSSHSFVPRITRVDEVDVRFGYQQWKVHTDRGPAEFRVQEREDIRFLPDGRFSIRDADGNVYELCKLEELDTHSRHAVEALL